MSEPNGECPNPRPDGFTQSHLMRLEDVLLRVWRPTRRAGTELVPRDRESRELRCKMDDWKTVPARELMPDPATRTLAAWLRWARVIWGPQKLDAAGVLVRLTVDVGKLARYVRGATKDRCDACNGTTYEGIPPLPFDDRDPETLPRCKVCGGSGMKLDLRLITGNILFSMIRWCDDLGLDPAECCRLAAEQQQHFAAENPER